MLSDETKEERPVSYKTWLLMQIEGMILNSINEIEGRISTIINRNWEQARYEMPSIRENQDGTKLVKLPVSEVGAIHWEKSMIVYLSIKLCQRDTEYGLGNVSLDFNCEARL